MKRLWIGLCVMVFLLISGIAVSAGFSFAHSPTSTWLQQAAHAALENDKEQALALSAQAQQRWQHFWQFTAAFADHAPMDEIDGIFAKLQIWSQRDSSAEYAALCAQLSQLIAALGNSHDLRWWTLL